MYLLQNDHTQWGVFFFFGMCPWQCTPVSNGWITYLAFSELLKSPANAWIMQPRCADGEVGVNDEV